MKTNNTLSNAIAAVQNQNNNLKLMVIYHPVLYANGYAYEYTYHPLWDVEAIEKDINKAYDEYVKIDKEYEYGVSNDMNTIAWIRGMKPGDALATYTKDGIRYNY